MHIFLMKNGVYLHVFLLKICCRRNADESSGNKTTYPCSRGFPVVRGTYGFRQIQVSCAEQIRAAVTHLEL